MTECVLVPLKRKHTPSESRSAAALLLWSDDGQRLKSISTLLGSPAGGSRATGCSAPSQRWAAGPPAATVDSGDGKRGFLAHSHVAAQPFLDADPKMNVVSVA